MGKLLNLFILIFILLVSCQTKEKKSREGKEKQIEMKINALSETEKREGWQLLFNGESLEGWKTYNGNEITGWKVVQGILHNSGKGSDHGGDIITKKEYEDFELYLEWKLTSQSNSGIFYCVQEKVVDAIYKSGFEYQLTDDEGKAGSGLNDDQFTGAFYAMKAPENAKVKPLGEWNSSKIIVNGAHIEHWLNGEKVVEDELWTNDWNTRKRQSKWKDESYYGIAKKGHIGLQDHGGLTMFRNIKIREL